MEFFKNVTAKSGLFRSMSVPPKLWRWKVLLGDCRQYSDTAGQIVGLLAIYWYCRPYRRTGLPTMGILSPKSTFSGIFTPVGDMSGIWGFFGDFWVFHENMCNKHNILLYTITNQITVSCKCGLSHSLLLVCLSWAHNSDLYTGQQLSHKWAPQSYDWVRKPCGTSWLLTLRRGNHGWEWQHCNGRTVN